MACSLATKFFSTDGQRKRGEKGGRGEKREWGGSPEREGERKWRGRRKEEGEGDGTTEGGELI